MSRNLNRLTIKIVGQSGQGVNVSGEIIAEATKDLGYRTFGYREYPSLIKGGYASYQIDIANYEVNSPSRDADILIAISRVALHKYIRMVRQGGVIVHSIPRLKLSDEEQQFITENHIYLNHIDAMQITLDAGGTRIMSNILLLGHIWKVCGYDLSVIEGVLEKKFSAKPELLEMDKQILKVGYEIGIDGIPGLNKVEMSKASENTDDRILSGNHALSLGAIVAGVRAFYAYPMTPASSILSYLAKVQGETGMLVKQAEDEITAAQMTIGSMFAGTRALVATSGGGFDLMTETVSLAGITETPFVCVIAQRPGPATGIPTWTAAGDLNLAIHGGHGEFPRCVLAIGDAMSAYRVIQEAFNLAEKYQTPVFVLTEKQIAESLYQVDRFPVPTEIQRSLVLDNNLPEITSQDRYRLTDSGISSRWLPGTSDQTYLANSDEHLEDGTMTEDSAPAKAMIEKRMRKMEVLRSDLPEPQLFGDPSASTIFVGWGSTKTSFLDAFQELGNPKVGYLHYEVVYPVKTELLESFIQDGKQIVLVENNFTGQLGKLLIQETGVSFVEKYLKYDGRPLFIEEVLELIEKYNS